jgi:hypothetical protein
MDVVAKSYPLEAIMRVLRNPLVLPNVRVRERPLVSCSVPTDLRSLWLPPANRSDKTFPLPR